MKKLGIIFLYTILGIAISTGIALIRILQRGSGGDGVFIILLIIMFYALFGIPLGIIIGVIRVSLNKKNH